HSAGSFSSAGTGADVMSASRGDTAKETARPLTGTGPGAAARETEAASSRPAAARRGPLRRSAEDLCMGTSEAGRVAAPDPRVNGAAPASALLAPDGRGRLTPRPVDHGPGRERERARDEVLRLGGGEEQHADDQRRDRDDRTERQPDR